MKKIYSISRITTIPAHNLLKFSDNNFSYLVAEYGSALDTLDKVSNSLKVFIHEKLHSSLDLTERQINSINHSLELISKKSPIKESYFLKGSPITQYNNCVTDERITSTTSQTLKDIFVSAKLCIINLAFTKNNLIRYLSLKNSRLIKSFDTGPDSVTKKARQDFITFYNYISRSCTNTTPNGAYSFFCLTEPNVNSKPLNLEKLILKNQLSLDLEVEELRSIILDPLNFINQEWEINPSLLIMNSTSISLQLLDLTLLKSNIVNIEVGKSFVILLTHIVAQGSSCKTAADWSETISTSAHSELSNNSIKAFLALSQNQILVPKLRFLHEHDSENSKLNPKYFHDSFLEESVLPPSCANEGNYNKIKHWVQMTCGLSITRAENNFSRNFIDSVFPNIDEIPFMDFFYKHRNEFTANSKNEYFSKIIKLKKSFESDLYSGNIASFKDLEERFKILESNDLNFYWSSVSTSVFCLGDNNFLMNRGSYGPGFGSLLSRFLHNSDISLTNQIISENKKYYEFLPVHIGSDEMFDGNNYPKLFDYSIKLPMSIDRDGESIIELNDLYVIRHGKNQCNLYSRSLDRIINPIDPGFMDPSHCSPIKRLLRSFCLEPRFRLSTNWMCVDEIQVLKSINIDNVTFSRYTILIPAKLVDINYSKISWEKRSLLTAYFLQSNAVKNTSFCKVVFLKNVEDNSPIRSGSPIEKFRSWFSPTYIDISSPWSMYQMSQLLVQIQEFPHLGLEFEEALPLANRDDELQEEHIITVKNAYN